MNILLYVFTLLMVMGIMTYAKLQTFLVVVALQSQYLCYMKTTGQEAINKAQKEIYETGHVPKGGPKTKRERSQGKKKLDVFLFVNPKERDTSDQVFQATRRILKNLMVANYNQQPFYQEMLQKRENFVEEILNAIVQKSLLPEYDGQISTAAGLANINLDDSDLQETFAKMMLGSTVSVKGLEECQKNKKSQSLSPTIAYPSLLTFITIYKKDSPIRIYLASPELLYAIYEDKELVNAILVERKRLYQSLPSGTELDAAKKEATATFKSLFEAKTPAGFPPNFLNFDVSKTNPSADWIIEDDTT